MSYRLVIVIVSFGAIFSCSTSSAQSDWSLVQCINHALENNLQVKGSQLNFASVRQNQNLAIGNYLPTVNGDAGSTHYTGFSVDPQTNLLINSGYQLDYIWLGSSTNLFSGFANHRSLKKARIDVKAGTAQQKVVKDEIRITTTFGYLNAVMAQEQEEFLAALVKTTEANLERIKLMVANERLSMNDQLETEVSLAALRVQHSQAKGNVRLTLLSLGQLVQHESPTTFTVEAPNFTNNDAKAAVLKSDSTYYQASIENLPSAELARLNHESNLMDSKIANSAFFPTLSFNLGLSSFYTKNDGSSDAESYNTQFVNNRLQWFGLSLNIPILNGGSAYVASRKAAINSEISSNQLDQSNQQLQNTVSQSVTNVAVARENLFYSEQYLANAKALYDNSQKQLDLGTVTILQMSIAQNRFIEAKAQFTAATYDLLFKNMLLNYYLTGTVQTPN
jgi:outer membrane protein